MNHRIEKTVRLPLENTYKELPELFFSKQYPEIVPSPNLVLFNEELASSLGIDGEVLKTPDGVAILSGNKIVDKTEPIAQAYAGHQFGYFTKLGDGRAILLGEYVTSEGKRVDIQLKGSGRTPYSRGGDGKATLGPMLREYIISEGMQGLGIPTTRSLAVVSTGEKIMRETILPGAILVRVADSHIRVGTFEYANRFGSKEELKKLADYTIDRHYPMAKEEKNPYAKLLNEVIKKQASLIAQWQLVGFIHGVMNTDNMAISGETIDYGPCAFMDTYDPGTVFSSIDTNGRYAYQNQPQIGLWNLTRFAEALLPLLDEKKEQAISIAQEELGKFSSSYLAHWYEGMGRKLGLFHQEEMDQHVIEALLSMMLKYHADYTHTFYQLTTQQYESSQFTESGEFKQWLEIWSKRRMGQKETIEESVALMKASNPVIIPRNYRVEEALERAVYNDDLSFVRAMVNALHHPYDYDKVEEYYQLPPKESGGYVTYCGT